MPEAGKKFKTFCRIIDYVDQADPELSELLRGTCADMTLNSHKGKAGITFIMPSDSLKKEIADLAYSTDVKSANKACDILNAHIFRDVYKTPADWKKSPVVPNSLYPSQQVDVESVAAKSVTFTNGATAELDEKFKDSSRKSNLAVWKLTKGQIPVTADKPAKLTFIKRKKPLGKVGEYELGGDGLRQNARLQIAIAVENAYLLDQLSGSTRQQVIGGADETRYASPSSSGPRDVYLEHTLSLVHFIAGRDKELLYGVVLPLISFQKVDFYNLLEPHRFTNNHLIPDALIHEWWSGNRRQINVSRTLEEVSNCLNNSGSNALIYKERNLILTEIDGFRRAIINNMSQPREIAQKVHNVYNELITTNSLGSAKDIFPEALLQFYRAEPLLKILQDELRYTTFLMFEALEKEQFDRGKFENILLYIAEATHAIGDEQAAVLKLLNLNNLSAQIAPNQKIEQLGVFVNSTYFVFIPLSKNEIADFIFKNVIVRPDPGHSSIWNIHRYMAATHTRLLKNAHGNDSDDNLLLQLLSQVNTDKLDPRLREQIKRLST